MTTDAEGNLYVTTNPNALNGVGVLEFAPDANGNVAPIRSLSSTSMGNWSGFLGVAVDSSGLIYVRATDPYCGAVFVFAADASGNSDPLRVLGANCASADDIDGTIAIFQ